MKKGKTQEQKHTTIKIMDVSGREIRNYEIGITNGKSVTIDMSGVAKGIYFVEIRPSLSLPEGEKKPVYKKIVVQ